jgi:hypothetical protein
VKFAIRLTSCLCALAFLTVGAGKAGAQSSRTTAPDADLSAMTTIRVTASQITPSGVSCGLSLGDVVPKIEQDLQAGGLKLSEAPDVLVTVSLLSMHDKSRGICATAVMLGSYQLATYYGAREGWPRSGYVVLWQRGNQVISTPADHPDSVDRQVSRLADRLLDGWRAAREKSPKTAESSN